MGSKIEIAFIYIVSKVTRKFSSNCDCKDENDINKIIDKARTKHPDRIFYVRIFSVQSSQVSVSSLSQ